MKTIIKLATATTPLLFALVLTLLMTGNIGDLQAKDKDPVGKAAGDTYGNICDHYYWRHLLEFSAQVVDDTQNYGKGFIRKFRQDVPGTKPAREEFCPVVYTYVEGNEAWFAGPIVYDSDEPDPDRWMVLYVKDGGQPKAALDDVRWQRVADGITAKNWVDTQKTNYIEQGPPEVPGYKCYEIAEGNVKVKVK